MATTYTIVPIPIWLSFDLTGVSAGGAQLFSWQSLDKTQPKPIFQDPAGALPYTNPINFNENGEAPGTFFFADDAAYFLQLCEPPPAGSAPGAQGPLIWQIDGYGPGIAGGGGGSITVNENLFVKNLVTNGVFYYNSGSSASPIGTTNLTLAPSNHDIFKPDIQFIKNNTNANDQITFPAFTLGSNPFTGDVTPEVYLQYTCTNTPASETQKCVQFPICKHVQNLNNQVITYSFWALGISGTQTLTAFIYQDFGSGGAPSVVAPVAMQTFNLSTQWTQFTGTFTVPSVSGKTVGTCGNDGLYLQIGFPLGAATTVAFTKVEVYLGDIDPVSVSLSPDFDSYDQVDSITNSPRTGDIRTAMNTFQPFGWVSMNDGTIGSASSGATTRANTDTFQLYNLIWNAMQASNQAYAPMYTNASPPVLTTYGVSAVADFTANNALSLTKALGQVLVGTTPLSVASQVFTADHTTSKLAVGNASATGTGIPVVLTNSGGALPSGLSLNTVYWGIYVDSTHIKLASSVDNAYAGTAVPFSDNGSGTNSVTVYADPLGVAVGERRHTLTSAELPNPLTTTASLTSCSSGGSGVVQASGTPGSATIANGGGGNSMNQLQPSTFVNMFIKL
jgi:hypothetical protein